MKGVTGHAILLAVAIVTAWVTWTREGSVTSEEYQATVWSVDLQAIDSITYASGDRHLSVSRRNDDGEDYLWGQIVQRTREVDGVRVPSPPDTLVFPVNDEGEDLFRLLAPLRALRELGTLESLGAERQVEYELMTPSDTLVVGLTNGEEERLLMGGVVFGGSGRYALFPENGRVYAISGLLSSLLDGGRESLEDRDLHDFTVSDVDRVVLNTPRSQRIRVRTGGIGSQSTWGPPEAPARTDATFGNFMSRVEGLRPMGFVNALPGDSLQLLAHLEYQDDDGDPMGTFELFRGGQGADMDDPAVETPFYLRTERTRVLARTGTPQAQRIAEDLEQLFSGEGEGRPAGEADAGELLEP